MYCSGLLQVAPLVLVLLSCMAPGCATQPPTVEVVTVEGTVTVRGNEPFAAYILETESRNTYVLNFGDAGAGALQTPARLRVTGTPYKADWNGRPYAHLRIEKWERIE